MSGKGELFFFFFKHLLPIRPKVTTMTILGFWSIGKVTTIDLEYSSLDKFQMVKCFLGRISKT